jgi:hypothetical protein
VTTDYPVLSAGPTPHTSLDVWDFSITGEVDQEKGWTWAEFQALPSEEVTVDIHCVTKWSKLDTHWRGVSIDTLLDGVDTAAEHVIRTATAATRRTRRWRTSPVARRIVYEYDGELRRGARRWRAHAAASPLLLEEREVDPGAAAPERGRAGLLGDQRLQQLRRPVEGTALLGRLTWQLADVLDVTPETDRVKTLVLDVPGWPGHRAGQHVDVRLTAEDGYQAERSYSIASAPSGKHLELTVECLDDGGLAT